MSFQRRLESRKNMYYVYIMASKRNGTLYIGVTNNLTKRVYEHKHNLVEGFTKKYGVHKLVYYEQSEDVRSAIEREKILKTWQRQWKLRLIEEMNPEWNDLYDGLTGFQPTLE
jgi:putative endonuclease